MKPIFLLVLASTVFSATLLFPHRAIAEGMSGAHSLVILSRRTYDPFAEGYQIGYRLGLEQGRALRTANRDYSPEILGMGGEFVDEADRRAAIGYQAGFLAGFQDGYYTAIAPSHPQIERFNEGYERGYDTGVKDALLCRYDAACLYNPMPTSGRSEDAQYDSGYKLGYWQAFDRAWNDGE